MEFLFVERLIRLEVNPDRSNRKIESIRLLNSDSVSKWIVKFCTVRLINRSVVKS